MNKKNARKIAETISNKEIKLMLDNAKENIKDWTKVSSCNKSFTKGVAWNLLAKDFDVNYNYHILAKTNFIREFGEYLPEHLKIKKQKTIHQTPIHQTPIF